MPKIIHGLHIVYLTVNQAWALMWFNHILGIYNVKSDAMAEMNYLLR